MHLLLAIFNFKITSLDVFWHILERLSQNRTIRTRQATKRDGSILRESVEILPSYVGLWVEQKNTLLTRNQKRRILFRTDQKTTQLLRIPPLYAKNGQNRGFFRIREYLSPWVAKAIGLFIVDRTVFKIYVFEQFNRDSCSWRHQYAFQRRQPKNFRELPWLTSSKNLHFDHFSGIPM